MKKAGKPKKELPTEVFEDHYEVEVGDVCIELTHYGGHKVDASVVWLPQEKVLFAGDLIFEGRYPYILSSDVPRWVEVLDQLPSYGAEVILPGHGTICTEFEIAILKDYLTDTWQRTSDPIAQGHTLEETLADPDYLRDDTWLRENLYQPNIEFMYQQLSET
jgi:cyclase